MRTVEQTCIQCKTTSHKSQQQARPSKEPLSWTSTARAHALQLLRESPPVVLVHCGSRRSSRERTAVTVQNKERGTDDSGRLSTAAAAVGNGRGCLLAPESSRPCTVDFDSLPRSTCLLFGDLHLECTRIGAFAYLLPGICQAWRSTVIRSSAISYAISLECNSTRLI